MKDSPNTVDQTELDSLPHGPEFRFIDKVTELDGGVSAKGVYSISGEEEFLKGHFPEQPMWPGVIMIEAIAQLGGVAAQSDPKIEQLKNMRLTAVKNAKVVSSAEPGAILEISVKVEGRMGTLIQISGTVSEQGEDGLRLLAKAMVVLSGS
ncbi:3-hydroxyacyl-ACP dehydratase FabZ family protein [Rubritalea sp.]|uniref:3-hydroxyacyl-ACP dehydratase FabZ family protein n=1 Tax=Rubritalea sp. TaxID=2109375 RepID=UPI003EFB04E9